MISGINRLPAAHAMSWRPGRGLRLWRYWQVTVSDKTDVAPERRAALVEEFLPRFEEQFPAPQI